MKTTENPIVRAAPIGFSQNDSCSKRDLARHERQVAHAPERSLDRHVGACSTSRARRCDGAVGRCTVASCAGPRSARGRCPRARPAAPTGPASAWPPASAQPVRSCRTWSSSSVWISTMAVAGRRLGRDGSVVQRHAFGQAEADGHGAEVAPADGRRRAAGHDLLAEQDGHPVGQRLHLVHVVGRQQHGRPGRRPGRG